MSELEICEVCEEATGKAGGVEDSLYLENWGGPFCDECYDSQVEELANSYGAVKAMALKYRATIAAKDAEIDRLLAVEVAAKKACREVIGRHGITAWSECLLCGGVGEFFDNVQHLGNCPVLVINPIGDQK